MKRNSLEKIYLGLTAVERRSLLKSAIDRGDALEAIRLKQSGPYDKPRDDDSRMSYSDVARDFAEFILKFEAKIKARETAKLAESNGQAGELPIQPDHADVAAGTPSSESSERGSGADADTAGTNAGGIAVNANDIKATPNWPRPLQLADYMDLWEFEQEKLSPEEFFRANIKFFAELLERGLRLKAQDEERLKASVNKWHKYFVNDSYRQPDPPPGSHGGPVTGPSPVRPDAAESH